jgi:hypothetical protein
MGKSPQPPFAKGENSRGPAVPGMAHVWLIMKRTGTGFTKQTSSKPWPFFRSGEENVFEMKCRRGGAKTTSFLGPQNYSIFFGVSRGLGGDKRVDLSQMLTQDIFEECCGEILK